MLLSSVCQRYLNSLGVDSSLFDISTELVPHSGGYELFIEVGNTDAYSKLVDLDTLILSKTKNLFTCSAVNISIRGDRRKPLRMSLAAFDILETAKLRSYPMPIYKPNVNERSIVISEKGIPAQLQWVAETAYDLNAAIWMIDFSGTYRYYQSRRNGKSIQPLDMMIDRQIAEQEIPLAIKQQVAFDHALAIESREIVTNNYISPVTGQEIITKTKPFYEYEMCVVFSMLRFMDQLEYSI